MNSARIVVVAGEKDGEPVHAELFYVCTQEYDGFSRTHLVRADSAEEARQHVIDANGSNTFIRCTRQIGILETDAGIVFSC